MTAEMPLYYEPMSWIYSISKWFRAFPDGITSTTKIKYLIIPLFCFPFVVIYGANNTVGRKGLSNHFSSKTPNTCSESFGKCMKGTSSHANRASGNIRFSEKSCFSFGTTNSLYRD